MLFQGQEFLEDRWFHDQDPLDWARADEQGGILTMYRDLIHLRRNLAGTTRGLCGQNIAIHHLNNEAKIIAFQRWDGDDASAPGASVIIVANMTVQPVTGYRIGLPVASAWQVRFNSDWQGYDEHFGAVATDPIMAEEGDYDGMPWNGALNIGPYSVVILSQE